MGEESTLGYAAFYDPILATVIPVRTGGDFYIFLINLPNLSVWTGGSLYAFDQNDILRLLYRSRNRSGILRKTHPEKENRGMGKEVALC